MKGPTEEPCQTCDICTSIALGQDVDVIEIDGASNNGVEQVRELRQNAALRPSRARYKIYYIDEVHMLSTGAFNALLKTLEEPPAHVKFLFATTEANKIPITVLSRCQRYDFAGITPEVIAGTLGEICRQEQVEAEPEALADRRTPRQRLAARCAVAPGSAARHRAARCLTVEVVNGLLGTASDDRLLAMLAALADHDAAGGTRTARAERQRRSTAGGAAIRVDRLRARRPGARRRSRSLLLSVSPRQRTHVQEIVERWTIDSILAALQILSECRSRMRGSLHGRLLVELALVRIARLEHLTDAGSAGRAADRARVGCARHRGGQTSRSKPRATVAAGARRVAARWRLRVAGFASRKSGAQPCGAHGILAVRPTRAPETSPPPIAGRGSVAAARVAHLDDRSSNRAARGGRARPG